MPEKSHNGVNPYVLRCYMSGEGTYLEGAGEKGVLIEHPHFTELRHHVGKLNGTNGDGRTPATLHTFSSYLDDFQSALANVLQMNGSREEIKDLDVGHGYTLKTLHRGLEENNDGAREVAARLLQEIVATGGTIGRYCREPKPLSVDAAQIPLSSSRLERASPRFRFASELFTNFYRRVSSRSFFRQSEKK